MSRKFGWIGSAVGGAIGGTVLWFVGNSFWTVNGRGLFERMGGPIASPWTFGIGGAILGAVMGIVAAIRSARRERQLTELCQNLGLKFEPDFPREDLDVWEGLSVVDKVSTAWNRMTGEASGVPFQMTDLRFDEGTGDDRRTTDQSVVLVATDEFALPNFELRPRSLLVKFMSVVGVRGVSFESTEALDLDPQAAQQFQRRYFVSSGLEELIEQMTGTKKEKSEPPSNSVQIRALFSPRLLRFFAEHPGWQVQGAGQSLAIWRPGRLVPPDDCPRFLAEALAIRSALLEAARNADFASAAEKDATTNAASGEAAAGDSMPGDTMPGDTMPGDSAYVTKLKATAEETAEPTQARILFMALGAVPSFFAGGIGGGFAAATLFVNVPPGDFGLGRLLAAAALFFGGAITGLVSGGLFGARVIAPAFERLMKRRRARQVALRGVGPLDQPDSSLATIEERSQSMTITLPALGLVAGGGGFLCFWSLFWNGMLAVMTPALVISAVHGNLKDEAGQPTSVWFMLLFLTPFWVIGIGSIFFLLSRARRRAEIQLDPERLVIVEKTLFGRQEYAWRRDEIDAVRVGSGKERSVNGGTVSIPHLVIKPYEGETAYFFGYRNAAEVMWLARLLQQRL